MRSFDLDIPVYWLKSEITFWLIQKAKKSYSDFMPLIIGEELKKESVQAQKA